MRAQEGVQIIGTNAEARQLYWSSANTTPGIDSENSDWVCRNSVCRHRPDPEYLLQVRR